MTPITLQEVRVAAHNAAFIANCQCPMRYRNTKWEQVWRELRAEAFDRLKAAQNGELRLPTTGRNKMENTIYNTPATQVSATEQELEWLIEGLDTLILPDRAKRIKRALKRALSDMENHND